MWHFARMCVDQSSFLPEWAPQSSVWIGWPSISRYWGEAFSGARKEIANLVYAVSETLSVRLLASTDEAICAARAMCGETAELHLLPMGDVWLRDIGPIYSVQHGALLGVTFTLNGWGGKYIMPGDSETAAAMLAVDGLPEHRHDFVLEGGAVDHDGAGTLLTTRQCVLNANRNPTWTEDDAVHHLLGAFHAKRIIWLDEGLIGDHTDGHVDNIARFIGKEHVVCQTPSGSDDPNFDVLVHIETTLRASGLKVSTIPSPGRVLSGDGSIMPASHMNFIFAGPRVFVPVYKVGPGDKALQALQAILPDHEIIGLPARHILTGGGAFHCISQHVPVFVS